MKKINIFENFTFIDLTHSLSSATPQWSTGCGFKHIMVHDYAGSSGEVKFRVDDIEMSAGIGTHMDAPLHCFANATSIAEIPLAQLIAPCVVIDVSARAHEKYLVTVEDIKLFEQMHGKINKNSFVIIYTGWDKFWRAPDKYRNNLVFPSISKAVAEVLLAREVVGIGIDTLSPDLPESGFPVHQLMLGNGKYIVENVANAKQVPAVGAYSLALPIKIKNGTEAPIRLIALVN